MDIKVRKIIMKDRFFTTKYELAADVENEYLNFLMQTYKWTVIDNEKLFIDIPYVEVCGVSELGADTWMPTWEERLEQRIPVFYDFYNGEKINIEIVETITVTEE